MRKKGLKNRKWIAGALAAAMALTVCGAAEKFDMADGVGSGGELRSGAESGSLKRPVSPGEAAEGDSGMMFAEPMAGGASGSLKDYSAAKESSSALPGEASDTAFPPEQEEILIEPAPGLLTAGEWRDNQNWGFLVNLVQTGSFRFRTFGIAPYQRVVVHVVSEGAPALNTRAVLYDAAGNILTEAVTDHTGTAYLYFNVYGEIQGTAEPDHVVLITPDGQMVTEGLDGAQSSLVKVEPGQNAGGQQPPQGDDIVYPVEDADGADDVPTDDPDGAEGIHTDDPDGAEGFHADDPDRAEGFHA